MIGSTESQSPAIHMPTGMGGRATASCLPPFPHQSWSRLSVNLLTTAIAVLTLSSVAASGFDLEEASAPPGLYQSVLATCDLSSTDKPGKATALAVQGSSGGQYIVQYPLGRTEVLARWDSSPEIACYSPESARALHRTVIESETIEGGLQVKPNGAIVCAFVGPTEAVCWQYTEDSGTFESIGGWIT